MYELLLLSIVVLGIVIVTVETFGIKRVKLALGQVANFIVAVLTFLILRIKKEDDQAIKN